MPRKIYNLQIEFLKAFKDSFPELVDRIEIKESSSNPNYLRFTVSPDSEDFVKFSMEIGDKTITFSSKFEDAYFATCFYPDDSEENLIRLICEESLDYFKEFVCGNVIVEYLEEDGEVVEVSQYHVDDSCIAFSAGITVKERKKGSANPTIVRRKVNWFGNVIKNDR